MKTEKSDWDEVLEQKERRRLKRSKRRVERPDSFSKSVKRLQHELLEKFNYRQYQQELDSDEY